MSRKEAKFWCCGLAAMVLVGCFTFVNDDRTIRVMDKQVIQEVHGDKDGTSTDIYYIIDTDNGSYRVETSGLFMLHGGAYQLEVGKTYDVHVKGFLEIQLLGVRPSITRINKSY